MLQSMKQLGGPRKKKEPKKPSLTYEAKTAQDKARIEMLARAEARKKSMATPLKANPAKLPPIEEQDTPEGVRKSLLYSREQESDIRERESEDYGRKPVKPGEAKAYIYGGQETMDQLNKPHIRTAIESLKAKRAKMEEGYRAKTKPKK